MRTATHILLLLAAALAGCQSPPPQAEASSDGPIVEASGVAYYKGELLIVDDSIPGTYFHFPLSEETPPGTVVALNEQRPARVELPNLGIWIDLESVDVLADGRGVVLSERLRSIVGKEGVVAEYDYPLTEMGRRGLEGLAVDPLPGGGSRIAVLWEGGYPDPGSLNPQIDVLNQGRPFLPMIFIHDLAPGEVKGRIPWSAGEHVMLHVPIPEGAEPDAQRFRAPDLVWFRPQSGPERFIVLLSSQNVGQRREYLHHWIQRFDMQGNPVGDPIDIAKIAPPEIANANWEGVCWLKPGESVVVVHEGIGQLEPHALVVGIPNEWRAGK